MVQCFQSYEEHLWNKSTQSDVFFYPETWIKHPPFCFLHSQFPSSRRRQRSVNEREREKDIFLLFGSILCFSTVGYHFVLLCFIHKHIKSVSEHLRNKSSPLRSAHCSDSLWLEAQNISWYSHGIVWKECFSNSLLWYLKKSKSWGFSLYLIGPIMR